MQITPRIGNYLAFPLFVLVAACGQTKGGSSLIAARNPNSPLIRPANQQATSETAVQHCLYFPDATRCFVQVVDQNGSSQYYTTAVDEDVLLLDAGVGRLNSSIEVLSLQDYESLSRGAYQLAYDRKNNDLPQEARIDCDDGQCGAAVSGAAIGGAIAGAGVGNAVGGPTGAAIGAAAGAIGGGLHEYGTNPHCGDGPHGSAGSRGGGGSSGGGGGSRGIPRPSPRGGR